MTDNGDGTWTTTVMMSAGDNQYKFQLDDWAIPEQFTVDQPCAISTDGGANVNRLVTVNGDATVQTFCFNSCDACGVVSAGQELPLTFEDASITYEINGFGAADFGAIPAEIIANPDATGANTSATVAHINKTEGAQVWAGASLPLSSVIDLSQGGMFELKVWSPRAGVPIQLKFEDTTSPPDGNGNPSIIAELAVNTATSNAWEVVQFDMTMATGYDAANNYNQAVIFPDFGTEGVVGGESFYFDDLQNASSTSVDGMITFTVDLNEVTDAFTTAYISGEFNGWNGTANPMTDNGDGTWTTTVMMPAGDNQYKFQLDDWAIPEQFTVDQPCAISTDGGNNVNRLVTVNGDATVQTFCFNSCDACVGVTMGQDLPLTFEDAMITYELIGFGGVDPMGPIDNPDATGMNTSAKVIQLDKTEGAEVWGGTSMPLETIIDFSTSTVMELKVWSPRAGVPILLKIEDTTSPPDMNGNPSIIAEIQTNTTTSNTWEVLQFDMSLFPDFSTSNNYNQVIVFPDFGTAGPTGGETYYFDDIQFSGDVAIDETELAKVKLTAFPNPADQQLNVQFDIPVSGKVSLTLVDVLGKTAQFKTLGTLNAGVHTNEVQVSAITSGAYVLLLRLDDQLIKTQTIIVR